MDSIVELDPPRTEASESEPGNEASEKQPTAIEFRASLQGLSVEAFGCLESCDELSESLTLKTLLLHNQQTIH